MPEHLKKYEQLTNDRKERRKTERDDADENENYKHQGLHECENKCKS